MRARAVSLFVLLAACGRGGPGYPEVDWGEPDAPRIPWLDEGAPPIAPPVLTPCPAGWTEVVAEGLAQCEPSPAARPDRECPPDGLPEVEGSPLLFVDDGATAPGDGSRATPYPSIRAALAAAPPGATIAVGAGTYDEVLPVRRDATLVGACAAETILAPTTSGDGAIVVRDGARLTVRDLTITGPRGGVSVLGAGTVELERVYVRTTSGTALWLEGDVAGTARDVVVEGSVDVGRDVPGVYAAGGARVELARVTIADVTGGPLWITDPTTRLDAEDLAIDRTTAAEGGIAYGIVLANGASARLDRTSIARVEGSALVITAGDLVATDLVIADGRTDGRWPSAYGIGGHGGASLTLRRARIERVSGGAIDVRGGGTSLDAEDLVVRDVAVEREEELYGTGIWVASSARGSVRRARIERTVHRALTARDRARLDLEDVVVRDVVFAPEDGWYGEGLGCYRLADCRALRLLIERPTRIGVEVSDPGTTLTASDVAVREVRPSSLGSQGDGLSVVHGGTVEMERALVEGTLARGVSLSSYAWAGEASYDARVTVRDLVVRDVRGVTCVVGATDWCEEPVTELGIGIHLGGGVQLDLERFVVEQARLGGYAQVESRARLAHGRIRETRTGVAILGPLELETEAIAVEDVEVVQAWWPAE